MGAPMSRVKCAIEGCESTFVTAEPISPTARYLCAKHSDDELLAALGRPPRREMNFVCPYAPRWLAGLEDEDWE